MTVAAAADCSSLSVLDGLGVRVGDGDGEGNSDGEASSDGEELEGGGDVDACVLVVVTGAAGADVTGDGTDGVQPVGISTHKAATIRAIIGRR